MRNCPVRLPIINTSTHSNNTSLNASVSTRSGITLLGAFSGLLFKHGWFYFLGVLYVIAGILLLIGRFVPIALVILGPILVNILLFHILFHVAGIAAGLVLSVFWILVLTRVWPSFAPLLKPTPQA